MSESLLASIHAAATGMMAPPAAQAPAPDAAAPAAAASAAPAAAAPDLSVAAEIAQLCAAASLASLASPLIRQGASVEQARARIAAAAEIREAVTLARKACPQIDAQAAEAYIAAGTPIAQVRADLFEKMAAVSAAAPAISQHQAGSGKVDAAGATGWAKTAKAINAQRG